MEINLWLILFQTIPFLVAMVLLNKIIFRPALNYLAERERNIDGFEREARMLLEEAEEQEQQLDGRLAAVRTEAGAERVNLLAETRRQEEALLKQAQIEAEAIIDAGTAEISSEEQQAQASLDKEAGDLSDRIASQVLGRTLAVFVVVGLSALLLSGAALASGDVEAEVHHGPPWKWLALHGVNLVIFLAILWRALRQPVADYLGNRRNEVAEGLVRARELSNQAKERSTAVENRLAAFDEERERIFGTMRERAQAERDGRLKRAERGATEIRATAERVVNEERSKARNRVRVAVAEKALSAARDRISAELGDADESRLWAEALGSLEEGRQ